MVTTDNRIPSSDTKFDWIYDGLMKNIEITTYVKNRLHNFISNGMAIFFTITGYKLNSDSDASLLAIS